MRKESSRIHSSMKIQLIFFLEEGEMLTNLETIMKPYEMTYL